MKRILCVGQNAVLLLIFATTAILSCTSAMAQSTPDSAALAPTSRGYFSHSHLTFEQVKQAAESAQPTTTSESMAVRPMISGGSGCTAAPEIVALANGLKNDPDLIYQYVHDNIEFDPLYGALKGPVGTLLDGRGDAFDQAALMVALLNQASCSNSAISNAMFLIGKVNHSHADLYNWLGGDASQSSIENILNAGAIPYDSVDSNGDVTGMGHVWVQVSINGTSYVFDPAFKTYNWNSGVPNLAGIMGYSQTGFTAAAGSPTITSDSIQGVNRNQLRNTLATYANNLASYIRTNAPSAGVSFIVGGGTIVPTQFTPLNGQTVRQTSLSYGSVTLPPYASIPVGYCATLQITLPGASPWPSLSNSIGSNSLYGHRLSIFFGGTSPSLVPTLYLDGSSVASGTSGYATGDSVPILFQITLPWTSWNIPSHQQQIRAQANSNGAGYIVMNGWDQVGRGMLEKHRKLLNQAVASGAASNSEQVLGESLEVEGFTWLGEVAAQQQLSDQLLGTKTQYYYGVGIVGEAVGASGTTSPYVDLPMNVVNTSARVSGANSLAPFLDESGTSSSFESASLEQLQALVPGFQAASTVKLIDVALQQNDTIYDINSANWSTFQNNLSNYLTNYQSTDLGAITSFMNQSAANASYRIIAPSNGAISLCSTTVTNCTSSTVPSWTGVGYKQMATTYTDSTDSTVFSVEYGEEISNGLNGGAGVIPVTPSTVASDAATAQPAPINSPTGDPGAINGTPGNTGHFGGDPLDLQKGSYQYQHNDLAVGAKGFPYGLSFERSYDSGAQGSAGPLGSGWTHNYAITATVNSDGFTGMGQGSALAAVSSIVALYVSSDLVNSSNTVNGVPSPNNVPLENYVLETVVNRWFTDQLTNNVVNVSQGWNTEEFTLMANGTYAPPLGSATILSGTPASFQYSTKTGITMSFNTACPTANCWNISNWSNAAGASVSFGYSGGLLSSVNSATGRNLTLSYSGSQISSVTDGNRTVYYGYGSGNLTSFTDAVNQKTTFSYDTSGSQDTAGHLTQVYYPSNPGNAFVTNFYDSLGRVEFQKDANGNLTQAFFAGSRTEMDDPVGNRHVWYMDSRGNVLSEIQDYGLSPHLNIATSNTYDAQSNLIKTTMPEGNFVNYTYDADFNPLTITQTHKPNSSLPARVQSFTYTAPVSSLPNFEEAASSTDPNGNVTTFTYNSGTGTLWKIDQPAVPRSGSGNVVPEQVFTYTSIGQPQTTQDAEGRITRFDYDSSHGDQVIKTTADYGRLNLVTQYGYDGYGDATSVIDANGNTTTSSFDALRRVAEVDAAISGSVTRYTYYPDGQVNTVARQLGTSSWETTQYTYSLSDKVTLVTDPLGNTTATAYDTDDRVQTVTQQVTATQNRQRTYSYDALSRLIQLSDTTGGSPGTVLETHAYTPNGNALYFADANGNTTTYVYDGFDRLDHTTYPDAGTEQYQYDANGNALQKTTRSGQTIGFSYDALNRVTTKTPQGEPAGQVTYGYDLTGRLLQASDGSSGTPYAVGYDTAGRANSYTDQLGRNTQVRYDGVGNRTRLQWPAGTNGAGAYFVTYQYDAMNRMTEIDENGSRVSPLAKYMWDSLSRQAEILHGDGTTDISQYDAGDNLLALTQSYASHASNTFSYTWQMNHQRASTTVSDGDFQYMPPTGTTNYAAANPDNEYTSAGGTTFAYDGNQNLTSDGFNTLAYDVENRLTAAQNVLHGTSQYWYDPMGNRKQKQVGSNVTQFVLAGGEEIADYQGTGAGTPVVLTVRGVGGLPVAAITPATGGQAEYVAYYHHDVMGSTVAASAAGGAPEVYTYGEFGAPGAGGSLQYTYAGYRYDSETGLYYVHARYYNPNLGRFLQTDPIGFQGGNNLYAYVGNDPVNLFDPSGLSAQEEGNDEDFSATGKNPTPGQRQPDGSYIAPTGPGSEIANIIDPANTPSLIGNGQCVTATKYFSGITAPTTQWTEGPAVANNGSIPIGTAIATFNSSGSYPTNGDQNSGIYMGPGSTPGSVQILDQWPAYGPPLNTPAEPPQIRVMQFNSNNGHSMANSASAYHVIIVP